MTVFSYNKTLQELKDDITSSRCEWEFFYKFRWKDGKPVCPYCMSENFYDLANRRKGLFKCSNPKCNKQYSAYSGSFLQGSRQSPSNWLIAILMFERKAGSVAVAKELKITQKSAWKMWDKIRIWKGTEWQRQQTSPLDASNLWNNGAYFNGKFENADMQLLHILDRKQSEIYVQRKKLKQEEKLIEKDKIDLVKCIDIKREIISRNIREVANSFFSCPDPSQWLKEHGKYGNCKIYEAALLFLEKSNDPKTIIEITSELFFFIDKDLNNLQWGKAVKSVRNSLRYMELKFDIIHGCHWWQDLYKSRNEPI